MTPEQKQWIDRADLTELLRKWRFAGPGDPLFQGDTGAYFEQVMRTKRDADNEAWVQASKQAG